MLTSSSKHDVGSCDAACSYDEVELACQEAAKLHLQACRDGNNSSCTFACVAGEKEACELEKLGE